MNRKAIIARWSLKPNGWEGGVLLDLNDALDLYRLQYLPSGSLALATRRAYLGDIAELIQWLELRDPKRSPTLLTSRLLSKYLDHLAANGLANSYLRRKVAAIRSFFRFLEYVGYIPHSPADALRPPPKEFAWPRVLSVAELARLHEVARHDRRDNAVIELLLQTGLLLSEVSGLRLDDVELATTFGRPEVNRGGSESAGSIQVNGRGRKQRVVALNRRACEALRSYLKIRPGCNDDHLFLTKFQLGMGPRAVERVVEKYLKEAGIEHASVQSFRHTYATRLLRRGVKLRFVQEALGHESLATTAAYARLAAVVVDLEHVKFVP